MDPLLIAPPEKVDSPQVSEPPGRKRAAAWRREQPQWLVDADDCLVLKDHAYRLFTRESGAARYRGHADRDEHGRQEGESMSVLDGHDTHSSQAGFLASITSQASGSLTRAAKDCSDEELVELIQSGNAHAAEVIYDRYVDLVRRIAGARCRSSDEVADVVQETFARILGRLVTFDGGAKLGNYIAKTASFVARDVVRADPSTVSLCADDLTLYSDSDDGAAMVETRDELKTILGEIPPAQAALLVERHLEDQSPREMALTRGTTPNTIRVQTHRARVAARQAASEKGLARRYLLPPQILTNVRRWIKTADRAGLAGLGSAAAIIIIGSGLPELGPGPSEVSRGHTTVGDSRPDVKGSRDEGRPIVGAVRSSRDTRAGALHRAERSQQPSGRPMRNPLIELPWLDIPATGHGVNQDAVADPDYAYGFRFDSAAGSVHAGIEVDDEPEQDLIHRAACSTASSVPGGYCATGDARQTDDHGRKYESSP